MKAIETTAIIDENGKLTLDYPLILTQAQSVRVIILISDQEEIDLEETPTEIVVEGIRQGLQEALRGQTIPLSEMWKGIHAE